MNTKEKIGHIIFEADTPAGKAFDVGLLIAIVLSVVIAIADSVEWIAVEYSKELIQLEWILTILFTIEYGLRIYSAFNPRKYIFSFYGIVDLLAILPTYISLLVPNTHYFIVIRALRLLRMFRVLKMARYVSEADVLMQALKASRPKITVFLYTVITLVIVLGTLMYLIEGREGGFSNIPISIYWAVVTLTTVGYGNITPQSPLGQFVAGFIMILGYGIIAVPTGIVTAELTRSEREHGHGHGQEQGQIPSCTKCKAMIIDMLANYCSRCGEPVNDQNQS